MRGGCCCEGVSACTLGSGKRVVTLHNWGSADPHVKITHTGVMCVIFLSVFWRKLQQELW